MGHEPALLQQRMHPHGLLDGSVNLEASAEEIYKETRSKIYKYIYAIIWMLKLYHDKWFTVKLFS